MKMINNSLKYRMLLPIKRQGCLLYFVFLTIVLTSCAGVPKNTKKIGPAPQVLIAKAMEMGDVKEIARICLEEDISTGDSMDICEMIKEN